MGAGDDRPQNRNYRRLVHYPHTPLPKPVPTNHPNRQMFF